MLARQKLIMNMSIGQGLSSNYYSLIVFVVGVLTATTWVYVTIIKEDDNDNNNNNNNNHLMMGDSDDDPFFSMTAFGACAPLALAYTCFAHAWLSVISRIGNGNRNGNDNGLQQWRKTPIIVASTTTTTKTKKLAIITGSNTGIGYETARRLVQEYGWDVILACRSKDKALIAKNKINNYETENDVNDDEDDVLSNNNGNNGKAIVLNPVLDLSDFDSIRKFVDAVQKIYDNVDVLINNAGRNTSGRSPGNPNLDLMFQSNYLGHFLLTELMLKNKLLLSSSTSSDADSTSITGNKVINLSSVMHHFAKGDNIDREEGGGQAGSIASPYYWKRRALYHDDNDIRHPNNIYAASKLAAILHTVELNRRYGRNSSDQQHSHLTAIAVNPGSVNSDIWRDFPNWVRQFIFDKIFLSTKEGSEPIVAAAIRNDLDTHQEDSISSNRTNIERGTIIYLQPYANPFSIFGGRWFPDSSSTASSSSSSFYTTNSNMPQQQQQQQRQSMIPFTEMFGPYVGHIPTIPRLPKNSKTTEAAAKVLWKVSEELTNVYNEK